MERKISGISEFPEKKDNLESLTEIFEKIFRKFSVPFDFEPEFSEILVEWKAPQIGSFQFVSRPLVKGRTTLRTRFASGGQYLRSRKQAHTLVSLHVFLFYEDQ